MRRLSVIAVLVGGIVDIVATNIAAIPIVIVAIAKVGSNTPQEELPAALASLRSDPLLFIAAFIVGSACSALGGYVAARIAKRAEVLNGALSVQVPA
jgi:hypothetical protein